MNSSPIKFWWQTSWWQVTHRRSRKRYTCSRETTFLFKGGGLINESNCCTSSVLVWWALIYSDLEELMYFTPHFHNLAWCRFLHCTISTICRRRASNICSCKLCPAQVLPVALHMCECRCTSEWQNLCKVKLDVRVSKSDVDILGCSCRPFSVCVCLVLQPEPKVVLPEHFWAPTTVGMQPGKRKRNKIDSCNHPHTLLSDTGYQHLKPTLRAILQYKAVGFSNPTRTWNRNVA
jgi:hypothetical protein